MDRIANTPFDLTSHLLAVLYVIPVTQTQSTGSLVSQFAMLSQLRWLCRSCEAVKAVRWTLAIRAGAVSVGNPLLTKSQGSYGTNLSSVSPLGLLRLLQLSHPQPLANGQ